MLPLNDSKDLYSALKKVNQNFKDAAHNKSLFKEFLFRKVVKDVFDGLAEDSSLLSNNEALLGEWKKLSSHAAKYLDLPFDAKVSQNIKNINACISAQSFFPGTACDLCEDMAQPIFACVARFSNSLSSPISRTLSPLACVCKKWNYSLNELQILHAIKRNKERKEIKEQEQKFLDAKFATAKAAVDFIIKEQLKIAPLSAFHDLTDELLEKLLQGNPNLKHLIVVQVGNITQLPKECSQLETLNCSHCSRLTSLPDMPNLIDLNCRFCDRLTSLPESLTQLMRLNCGSTPLTALPDMPYLIDLECAYSWLTSLPAGLTQLKKLNCSNCNYLISLPQYLPQLISLDCGNSKGLTQLPDMPSLLDLNCGGCFRLANLPERLTQLRSLECIGCTFKNLPECLANLVSLNCSSCMPLKRLPECLSKLTSLNCSYCPLESLPACLKQLTSLNCEGCRLTCLPDVPHLTRLICGRGALKYLPIYLAELTSLDCCFSRKLTHLPIMPKLEIFQGVSCPNLTIAPGDLPEGCVTFI